MSIRSSYLVPAAFALTGLLTSACGVDDNTGGNEVPPIAEDMLQTYAEIVVASYEDSITAAQELQTSINAFVAAPSEVTLGEAQLAWRDSRPPYLQTEVYRFYNGPIDNEETGPEGLLNAWPLDEAYIDYVADDAASGIVNDATVTIDADTLVGLNEGAGEAENVSTGYHAVEFLLWGQDMSETGPGERPFTDYISDGTGTADNQERRAEYLTTSTDLIITHLQDVLDQWVAGGEYRTEWDGLTNTEGLTRVMTGMIILSGFETGGERLQAALDTGEQEDEHSCFSDNTHVDMIEDVRGVQNVWLGTYQRIDGTVINGVGVRDVVEAVNADLATQITDQIATALAAANALQVPFDQEISFDNSEGRERVTTLVTELRSLESMLEDAFREFGLDVPVAE